MIDVKAHLSGELDAAYSTSLYVDPREDLVGVLMAECLPAALRLPPVVLDFWTSVSQAIDDGQADCSRTCSSYE